jgi:hypothetical protein
MSMDVAGLKSGRGKKITPLIMLTRSVRTHICPKPCPHPQWDRSIRDLGIGQSSFVIGETGQQLHVPRNNCYCVCNRCYLRGVVLLAPAFGSGGPGNTYISRLKEAEVVAVNRIVLVHNCKASMLVPPQARAVSELVDKGQRWEGFVSHALGRAQHDSVRLTLSSPHRSPPVT